MLVIALLVPAFSGAGSEAQEIPSPIPLGSRYPVLMAAGDIACDPASPYFRLGLGSSARCRHKYTSDLLVAQKPTVVLTLGDNQYEDGAFEKFLASYSPTWGRVKPITRPSLGNHDYRTPGASGYFDYFGAAAGRRGRGYYSFDVGSWHIVVLNSNCWRVNRGTAPNGCAKGSPQNNWLERNLAATTKPCILAAFHHPRWSSAYHGNTWSVAPFVRDLYRARADVLLVGHDHSYERFRLQRPDGRASSSGIRQFVVGTGGKSLYRRATLRPNSQVFQGHTFGVLQLTLRPRSYSWRFVPEAGRRFTDSGWTRCH